MQEVYDRDPERWEREEQEARERYQMEQEEMRMQEAREYERWQEQKQAEVIKNVKITKYFMTYIVQIRNEP